MANAVGCKAAKTARFHQAEFAEMKAEYRSRNNEPCFTCKSTQNGSTKDACVYGNFAAEFGGFREGTIESRRVTYLLYRPVVNQRSLRRRYIM